MFTFKQTFDEEAPLPTILDLPPLNLSTRMQHRIIDVYAANIYPYFPIVEKRDLLAHLDKLDLAQSLPSSSPSPSPSSSPLPLPSPSPSPSSSPLSPSSPSPCDSSPNNKTLEISPLLFFAILAISANHITGDDASSCAEALFAVAQNLAMCYLDAPRCSTVLALVLMAGYLERDASRTAKCKSTKARMFAGMSFAMARELGLHKDRNKSPDASTHLCSKIFWSLFAYDRILATMHCTPLTFDERECNVAYPSEADEATPEAALSVREFTEYVKLATCLGRIVRLHASQPNGGEPRNHWTRDRLLASLDSSLATWFLALPPRMRYATQSVDQAHASNFVFILNIFFYWALIILHGPYIAQETSVDNTPLRICTHAADQIRLLVDDMDDKEEGEGDEGKGEDAAIFSPHHPLQTANAVYALRDQAASASSNSNASSSSNSSSVIEIAQC